MLSISISAFLLGLLHSLEPDHIVMISTILAKYKNSFRSMLMGMFWGLGHALMVILFAIILFYIKNLLPENIFIIFEFLVVILLLYSGFDLVKSVFLKKNISQIHHNHNHDNQHNYFQIPKTENKNNTEDIKKNTFSFFIGSIQGLAGSGTIIALLFAGFFNLSQLLNGVIFFGLGTIISMAIFSFILSLSLNYCAHCRFPCLKYLNQFFPIGIGFLAMIFGFYKIVNFIF